MPRSARVRRARKCRERQLVSDINVLHGRRPVLLEDREKRRQRLIPVSARACFAPRPTFRRRISDGDLWYNDMGCSRANLKKRLSWISEDLHGARADHDSLDAAWDAQTDVEEAILGGARLHGALLDYENNRR